MLAAVEGLRQLRAPILYAHRGASLAQPENSLEGFAAALALGADALEIDVHLSRDGHVMVAHDGSAERTAGVAREIRACDLSEIKSWDLALRFRGPPCARPVRMPTLDEVLSAFPRTPLNIDVKQSQPDMLVPLLELIARHAAEPRVLLTSFSSLTVRRIRRLGYTGSTGLGLGEAACMVFAPAALLAWLRPGGVRLQVPLRHGPVALDRGALVRKMHALGVSVDYWVVNEPGTAQRLLALGADGIVTDDPRAMAALFARSPQAAAWRARHPELAATLG